MQKLDEVLVTAEVQLTANKAWIGTCIRGALLTPEQCDTILTRLRKVMGGIADWFGWEYCKHSTIICVRTGVALCRRSLLREMRRFKRVLEAVGLAETARVCSPFKPSYR